jgi:hypothetical protein
MSLTQSPFGDSLSWRIGDNIPWVVPWSDEEEFSVVTLVSDRERRA